MKAYHLILAPGLLLALAACGNSTDDSDTPATAAADIPENQGTNSGMVGDGAPDVAPAQPPVHEVQPGQPATAVGGMNYPVTGKQ